MLQRGSGHFNTSGNDGTITRFGWKAQNKSLLMFAGEAHNVEMGVTNELFPNERNATTGCAFNPTLERCSTVLCRESFTRCSPIRAGIQATFCGAGFGSARLKLDRSSAATQSNRVRNVRALQAYR
ncbi:MAG: hypothetical protein JOZ58_17435 [Acetobacteraceae bacterium]|nr:hypothetical protein [Acetobacteraceae bacterium]